MRVLMLESHPGVANHAVAELTEAGHTIVRCDTPDRRYPCRGLKAVADCPLDEHVDVAVLVQEIGTHHVEHGAVCAARCRIPVVAVDSADLATRFPITAWTTAADSDLVDQCERASHDGRAHTQAVAARLVALGVVAPAELQRPNGTVTISVDRGADRLLMTIELADSVRDREDQIMRTATQALRDFDRRSAVIDIVVRPARSDV
jgi:hypothetical protein